MAGSPGSVTTMYHSSAAASPSTVNVNVSATIGDTMNATLVGARHSADRRRQPTERDVGRAVQLRDRGGIVVDVGCLVEGQLVVVAAAAHERHGHERHRRQRDRGEAGAADARVVDHVASTVPPPSRRSVDCAA